jgi:hypothetical protein
MLKIRHTEFVTDIEGDKAEGDARNDIERANGGNSLVKAEAEAADHEAAETVRTDQHAGDQIGGYIGELEPFKHTSHHKTRKHTHGYAEQSLNGIHSVVSLPDVPGGVKLGVHREPFSAGTTPGAL